METVSAQFINMLMDRVQTLEAESLIQSRTVQSLVDSMTALKSSEPVVIRADTDHHSHITFTSHYHVYHESGDRFFRTKAAASDYLRLYNQSGYISHIPTVTMNNTQYHRILLHPQPLCFEDRVGVVEQ